MTDKELETSVVDADNSVTDRPVGETAEERRKSISAMVIEIIRKYIAMTGDIPLGDVRPVTEEDKFYSTLRFSTREKEHLAYPLSDLTMSWGAGYVSIADAREVKSVKDLVSLVAGKYEASIAPQTPEPGMEAKAALVEPDLLTREDVAIDVIDALFELIRLRDGQYVEIEENMTLGLTQGQRNLGFVKVEMRMVAFMANTISTRHGGVLLSVKCFMKTSSLTVGKLIDHVWGAIN
jgi:hypothetical protein